MQGGHLQAPESEASLEAVCSGESSKLEEDLGVMTMAGKTTVTRWETRENMYIKKRNRLSAEPPGHIL